MKVTAYHVVDGDVIKKLIIEHLKSAFKITVLPKDIAPCSSLAVDVSKYMELKGKGNDTAQD